VLEGEEKSYNSQCEPSCEGGDLMVLACVLVFCEPGKFEEVLRNVKELQFVKRAFSVLGRCDVVAEIDAPTLEQVGLTVYEIARIDGVTSTETLVETIM